MSEPVINQPAPPTRSGARSDLPTRFAVGVLLIAIAIVETVLGGWPFRLLVAAAAAAMMWEWADMHRVPRTWAYVAMALLVAALLAGVELLYPAAQWEVEVDAATFAPNWLAFAGLALLSLVVGLVSRRLAMIGGFLYIALPSFSLLSLSWVWVALVFWVFLVTWATDILAYFAGRAIGGPKLAPRISPNKTWAGLAGGVMGAGLFGWLVAWWFEMEPLFHWLGFLMGAVAQAGDLLESWVKRRCEVKDSGRLLPGHGGVLDRLDGLLAVAFATTLLLMAGLWTA